MNYNELLDAVQQHVIQLFHQHQNPLLVYHNLSHTQQVVKNARGVCSHLPLTEQEMFIVVCAAWFHDVGYLIDIANHEKASADVAEKFLLENGLNKELIEGVKQSILATKMPQQPQSIEGCIVCDADLYHLGTADFDHINEMVREEKNQMFPGAFTNDDWLKGTIALFEHHDYKTAFCRKHLSGQKQKNLEALLEQLKAKGEPVITTMNLQCNPVNHSDKSLDE